MPGDEGQNQFDVPGRSAYAVRLTDGHGLLLDLMVLEQEGPYVNLILRRKER